MKGLLSAIRRPAATQAPPPAQGAPERAPTSADAPEPSAPLPAGVDADAEPRATFVTRGRLRRRLRYLRRVRELGLRDVGGLVFDQHRFGQPNPDLVAGKLAALSAVDGELRTLERVLGSARDVTELREPGISACPRCGAVHGSDARFCPACGVALRGPRAVAPIGESFQLGGAAAASAPPAAAPAAPRPAASEPATQPTEVMPAVAPAADPSTSANGGDAPGDGAGGTAGRTGELGER